MYSLTKKKKITPAVLIPPANRAFTLIELMVSISIIVLVTSIIMVRQSAFNGTILLRNQAFEVAFALRQTQLLAVSGTNNGATTAKQQYGVNFSMVAGSNQTYQVFQDKNGNGQNDAGDAYGPIGRLDKRFEIRDVTRSDGVSLMGASKVMNVYFTRPNFDAVFKNGNGTVYNAGPVYIKIAKVGSVVNENVRCVEVTGPGQMQVRDCP